MSRSKFRSYSTNTSLMDLLFLTCAGFTTLFVLSFVQIQVNKKAKHDVEFKAEYMITFTWPNDMDCDVDSYVGGPNGELVMFRRREEGLIHLDRDDLGTANDKVFTPYGIIEYKENREIVVLRGIAPGEYTVNVHMFAKRSHEGKVPVTVRLEKVNPYAVITQKVVELELQYEEKTAFRFTLDEKGKVTEISDLEKKLATTSEAYQDLQSQGYYEEQNNGPTAADSPLE